MLSYCLKCKKKEIKNPRVVKIKNGETMLSSTCAVCRSKQLRFFKGQQASTLLSSLGIRTP